MEPVGVYVFGPYNPSLSLTNLQGVRISAPTMVQVVRFHHQFGRWQIFRFFQMTALALMQRLLFGQVVVAGLFLFDVRFFVGWHWVLYSLCLSDLFSESIP